MTRATPDRGSGVLLEMRHARLFLLSASFSNRIAHAGRSQNGHRSKKRSDSRNATKRVKAGSKVQTSTAKLCFLGVFFLGAPASPGFVWPLFLGFLGQSNRVFPIQPCTIHVASLLHSDNCI